MCISWLHHDLSLDGMQAWHFGERMQEPRESLGAQSARSDQLLLSHFNLKPRSL